MNHKIILFFIISFTCNSAILSETPATAENNAQPSTVVEYLKQEQEKTSKILDLINEEYVNVLNEVATESPSPEVFQKAVATILEERRIQTAPTILRNTILICTCNCIQDQTFSALPEEANSIRCLTATALFLQSKDELKDNTLVEEEFNRVYEEIRSKFSS